MNYLKSLTFFFCLSLLFTSCFELREEINMKDDGSGDLKIVVNLSESKENVKKYMTLEEVEGFDIPKDKNIESILKHVRVALEGVKGMSDIKVVSDYEDFIFTVTSKFTNVEVVNEAVSTLTKQLSYLYIPHLTAKNFSYEDGLFTRHFDYPINVEEYNQMPSMQRYVFETARAISIYRFGKEIKDYSNKSAVLSPSRKAIKLESNLANLATQKETLENKITF